MIVVVSVTACLFGNVLQKKKKSLSLNCLFDSKKWKLGPPRF